MDRTLKYPVKLGKHLYPAGTVVRVATMDEVRTLFPEIPQNEHSPYIGVVFPELTHPTVILKRQLNTE